MKNARKQSFNDGTQPKIYQFFPRCKPSLVSPVIEEKAKRRKRQTTRGAIVDLEFRIHEKPTKRRLPAPIFSDEESDDSEILVHLTSPKRAIPLTTSTPLSNNVTSETTILEDELSINYENTIIGNTEKSIRENVSIMLENKSSVKTESKKINFEYVTVMRTFFGNVLKTPTLKALISQEDEKFLSDFFESEKEHQFMCIKLFLWKSNWYNVFKYVQQIGINRDRKDVLESYHILKAKGFIDTNYLLDDTWSLLRLLPLKDLLSIGKVFKLPKSVKNKDNLITELVKNCRSQVTLSQNWETMETVLRNQIQKHLGFCMKISNRLRNCLFWIYLLNTYTNLRYNNPQEYFADVLYVKREYPSYITEAYNVFSSHLEFVRFAEAVQLRCEVEKKLEKKDWDCVYELCKQAFLKVQDFQMDFGDTYPDTKLPYLEHFTACSIYISIVTIGIKLLTKNYYKDLITWIDYLLKQDYSKHKRGFWYCQLILIYTTYLKDFEQAAKALILALRNEKSNLSEVQLHELAFRGIVLKKKRLKLCQLYHNEIIELSPPSCECKWPQEIISATPTVSQGLGQKLKFREKCLNGDIVYLNVEEKALDYYKKSGYSHGMHCEGQIIITAFCMLFWDLIYDKYVKGVFLEVVQEAPLDMFGKYFYINRKVEIEKRLKEIGDKWSDEKFGFFFVENWKLHSHEASICSIDTLTDNPQMILDALFCIGRLALSRIFSRLVQNYRVYSSGFPDLIVWNIEERKAKFVEIKSENDKLSIKQKLWLKFLMEEAKTEVEVCHVLTKGSKKLQRLQNSLLK